MPPDRELGIGPERKFQEVDRALFRGKFQCGANTLAAFEKSQYPDDWRDLMRLYMVRRTRGFIKANYAKTDLDNGRKYLEFKDGSRSYFPDRLPKKLPFVVNENDPNDEYAKLYSAPVVDIVNGLSLPRYGLGNSVLQKPPITATKGDEAIRQTSLPLALGSWAFAGATYSSDWRAAAIASCSPSSGTSQLHLYPRH